jgi:hypothetical protein
VDPFRRRPSGEHDAAATRASEARLRAGPGSATSGLHALPYAEICRILRKYLSPILVESVLQKAMQSRSLTSATLNAAALAEITGDIMVGLRLFVPAERLPSLMLELAEVLDVG